MVAYGYDAAGDLVAATDARGGSFAYRYEDHLLVEERWRRSICSSPAASGSFRPLAQVRREAANAPGQTYHYHLDRLGAGSAQSSSPGGGVQPHSV